MSRIYQNMTQLIGNTPLIELSRFCEASGIEARILAKLERQNPGGSAKDRIALAMIKAAEKSGELAPGGTIIEPTSGNTGVGLAAIATVLGYKAVIVMPDSMSVERRKLIAAYGAEIVLTPGAEGMAGAVQKAQELKAETPGSIIAGQFENPANPEIHYNTTGPEIWRDSAGCVDIFVAGVGTGGTVTGVGRYLREQNPDVEVVAVEPAGSPLLTTGKSGSHKIQGIGANFVPQVLDVTMYSEAVTVTDEAAYAAMRLLTSSEGLLCGVSSGAALHAATELARKPQNQYKTIVVLLPDTGERYLSLL